MDYQTPQFFRVMQYADAADRDVVDMVSGNPDWDPPAALRDGLREYAGFDAPAFQYPASEGLEPLREEIAARRGVDPYRVVVTNGAGEANYLAMAEALAGDRGSEVLLADPVYPYYAGRTNMLGGDPSFVPAEPDGCLDPARVREAASEDTAAIVVNSPNNPTGAVYGEGCKRELVAVADAYDALLISDEVYDHFDYAGRFWSALSADSDAVVVTNAFSKSMAITGWRVGYAILPEQLVERVRSRHMLVNVTSSRPAQYAVLRALRETSPEYYERNRALVRDRIASFTDALDDAGAAYTTPEGSFYVLAKFPDFAGTMANAERLVDGAGVAGMPGDAFGTAFADWFRFALVTPRADAAGERLAAYF